MSFTGMIYPNVGIIFYSQRADRYDYLKIKLADVTRVEDSRGLPKQDNTNS